MKDRAKSILLPENPFEKVHGHTRIELTDIKSGKKKIIEHDNDFQSGVLAKYMRSMGAYNNNPYANSTWAGQPIWRNLCGGVFCFRDAIDNTGGEVEYMPAGNQMTANGAYGVSNSGTPVEMGSYNSVESQTSGNDSITFVYDYTSSQGNGTIACVCLTTEIGGYIGYGNPSGVAHATKKNLTDNQSSATFSGWIDGNYRYSFQFDAPNKTLAVTKTPVEITKGSIFDGVAEDTIALTFTAAYPQPVTGTSYNNSINSPCYMQIKEHEIAIMPQLNAHISVGGTYTILIYHTDTDTLTEKTITNTTSETLKGRIYGHKNNMIVYAIDDTCVYMQGNTTNKIYAINMDDSTYTEIDWSAPSMVGQWFYGGGLSTGRLSDGLLLSTHETTDGYSRTYGQMGIIDRVSGTRYPINSNQYNLAMIGGHDALRNVSNLYYSDTGSMGNLSGGIYKNPLILSTINNLDTPVTKTAAQTMKITYTLSKATE